MSKRVAFLVDGFNLYHSIRDLINTYPNTSAKWLNINSICKSFLHFLGKDAVLESIYYFSAYAYHLNDPGVVHRHRQYVRCLEDTGITTIMSRFKAKQIRCPLCRRDFTKYDEKETDVAMSLKLVELASLKKCDIAVIITGDTDVAPAVRAVNGISPNFPIYCVFPFKRKNNELSQISTGSFKMRYRTYVSNQFTDPFILSDGTPIQKPASW